MTGQECKPSVWANWNVVAEGSGAHPTQARCQGPEDGPGNSNIMGVASDMVETLEFHNRANN